MPTDNPKQSSDSDKKKWVVVEITVDRSQEEMAGWLMIQLGANGCEIIERESSGTSVVLHATFEEEKLDANNLAPVNAALDEYGLSRSIGGLRLKTIFEEDWLAEWKKGFLPFQVGERFVVCPPWEKDALDPQMTRGRQVIFIEPGLAFGTGFHATTQFCLKAIEQFSDAKTVIDVGTGSGILAIGVALINCKAAITAVETDPVACRVARENFALNQVSQRINLLEGSTEQANSRPYELILSNLTQEDHSALLPEYVRLTAPGSHMIFAGILKEKVPNLLADLQSHKLKVVKQEIGDMWAGLVVSR